MVNVTHNADYRRSWHQCGSVFLFLFQKFLDHIHFFFLLCNDIKLQSDLLCLFKVDLVVYGNHDAFHKQFLYDYGRLHFHLFSQLTDSQLLRDHNLFYFLFLLFLRLWTNRFLKGFRKSLIRTASLVWTIAALTAVFCSVVFFSSLSPFAFLYLSSLDSDLVRLTFRLSLLESLASIVSAAKTVVGISSRHFSGNCYSNVLPSVSLVFIAKPVSWTVSVIDRSGGFVRFCCYLCYFEG